ncbi:MAG: ParD-like family protein [Burkholderiaceae bacterium]|nr:ParD-like family protein [Burkholderiaceae bacterium]
MPQHFTHDMSSNSLRINAELFEAAAIEGKLMSRSAAQQIEHWAKLGLALESCGLTVDQMASLLRTMTGKTATDVVMAKAASRKSRESREVGEMDPLAFKQQRQKDDLEAMRAGRVSQEQLGWFFGGKAKRLKIAGSPY